MVSRFMRFFLSNLSIKVPGAKSLFRGILDMLSRHPVLDLIKVKAPKVPIPTVNVTSRYHDGRV